MSTGRRRQRIVDATLKLIKEDGLRGLSHRRVAKEAEVTLSATSYYFGTFEDLVAEAFTEAAERDRLALHTWLEALPPDADLIKELAVMVHDLIVERETAVMTDELCVAALRSDRLRPLAYGWGESWHQALLPYMDELTAAVAVALTSGIIQQGLVSQAPPSAGEIEAMLRQGLGAPAPGNRSTRSAP